MRTIARAFSAAALVFASACDNPGVTKPTTPEIPIGTPQSLTLDASPTTIPITGANVRILAAVGVEPGARVPGSLSLQFPGSSTPTLVPLASDGRLDQVFWLARGGDLIASAGSLERRVAITQLGAPAPPEPPPPTCGNGGSWPCPTPAPTPTIAVSITATPSTGDMGDTITFVATATSKDGAPPATLFDWQYGDSSGEKGVTATRSHPYLTPGTKTVSVTAHGGNVVGGGSTSVTIAAPAVDVIVTASPNPAVLTGTPARVNVTLTVDAKPTHRAGAISTYEWDWDGNGTYEDLTKASTSTRSHDYTAVGTVMPKVRVRTEDGAEGIGTVRLSIASAVIR